MSGFRPNMWKFKQPKPSSALPTTNKFWANIDVEDDEYEASESIGDDNNTAGNKTDTPNANNAVNATTSELSGSNESKDVPATLKGNEKNTTVKICYKCGGLNHIKKRCPLKTAENDTEDGDREISPNTATETKLPKKKLLNLTVKCYHCKQEGGHPSKACPKRWKKLDGAEDNSIIVCMMCKTQGHFSINCPMNPANKKTVRNPSALKPVLTGVEQLIKDNKCSYCGVQGHFIQACPVKKWRVAPGVADGTDFTEDFTSFADGESPEPRNPSVVAAGAPGKGKPIQSLTTIQMNKAISKKEKELKKHRAQQAKLLAKQIKEHNIQQQLIQQQQTTMMGKPVQPVPVNFVNHPSANINVPVNSVVPQEPIVGPPNQHLGQMLNVMAYRACYPAGIPKSFLNQHHQEQILQQNTKQLDMASSEPNQQTYGQEPTFTWPQAPTPQTFVPTPQAHMATPQTFVPTSIQQLPTVFTPVQKDESMDSEPPQAYSPSDVYGDLRNESGSTEPHEGSESPDPQGQKRLSAFQRLGPATQKKPKLTINLSCNKGQAVREVVDETTELVEEHTPVHLRHDVTTSTDEIVMKYLYFWPWRKPVATRRVAAFKTSKSAMLLEQEQMEELYEKDNVFIQITVTNYPKTWTKEELFDVFLEQVNVIPCFIEFTSKECKFLVIRSKPALVSIHKMGFKIRKGDIALVLKISITLLTQNQIDFLPRLVLRKRLGLRYDGGHSLDLHEFTLKSDISHFIYFPLNRLPNQTDLIQMQSVVDWDQLTELNLSRNRLTSIDGFHLSNTCPNLKILDLSNNYLDKVTALLRCRNLPLRELSLEGNPLCHDFTDPNEYLRLVKMLFPTLRVLDGVTIYLKGDLPGHRKNFCPHGAESIVEKYLDTFFPLLEAQPSDRQMLEDMYDENALMNVLYRYKFIHRLFRISSNNSKFLDDGLKDVIEGATSITKYINKWPVFKHDPFTFTVDILSHNEQSTIIKICGILKLTAESLAEDEHIISFSRTTVLHTSDRVEYKIVNELLLWDEPSNECYANAFQITKIRSKKLYVDLDFESTPDEETKEKLIVVFEHLTELDRHASRKCLERKNWNLKNALDNFMQLLKLNDLSSIRSDTEDVRPIPIPSIDQHGRERQLLTLTVNH
ncbi:uncharacterized protein LOC128674249 isoform X2 [Plodia interpunctella]|uniref:uncharacterized protein LOC128674249 isoform X2 n=1 Tax=Plodia interpunctella TaxID=58824 RepID=UPI0023677FA0|nr:uncharacterized protein LOC128674249 isoform X2 [Plodia interpunctella]